jgi:RHS repeat-associated protein
MGIYTTALVSPKPHPEVPNCAPKTASREIFSSNRRFTYKIERNPLKTQQGKLGYTYKTASGRSTWPSRDPIEEKGGVNLYTYVGNDPIGRSDRLGMSPIAPIPHPELVTPTENGNTLPDGTYIPHDHVPECNEGIYGSYKTEDIKISDVKIISSKFGGKPDLKTRTESGGSFTNGVGILPIRVFLNASATVKTTCLKVELIDSICCETQKTFEKKIGPVPVTFTMTIALGGPTWMLYVKGALAGSNILRNHKKISTSLASFAYRKGGAKKFCKDKF